MIFDELKCYNSVSLKPRSLKWGGKSFFSYSVENVLGISLRYSEAVVQRIRKIYRKTTLSESFFKEKLQAAGRLKKRLQQSFKRTLPEDCSKNYVFSHLFWQFFTRIPEIIVTFPERFIFQIIGLFLLFMSGFYTMEPRQVDEPSNRTKQRYQVFMQAWAYEN